ncbi:MAG: PSD1 domain-containing protein [Planctomycetales bacterium]|nr:PSD1 domain-containing protein [Planctomycetales bacterium]
MTRRNFSLGVVLLFAVFAGGANGQEDPAKKPVNFAREVLPILSNKCFVCHGPDADEDNLHLDSFESATQDLGAYKAINPDAPEESQILVRIHDQDNPMPPEEAEKQLTEAERAVLDRWVRQGGTYEKHWAFVPPEKCDLPHGENENPIDQLVREELRPRNVDLAPEADRETLARRVALVLTGLPPDPEQLRAFVADQSDDAYEKYVELMLASPRFGEHQARYWLDAVRYGDTHGLHLDNRRGIYPYRDWVVHALNENLPLDDFIRWQLAGDLLPNPNTQQLVATGFVRMNPTTSEGGVIPAEFQAKNNFDRTENLGTVLLGMTLTCARCHTHKYDPITQTEYYQLLAFFNSTAESPLDGNSYEYGPTLRVPANQAAWSEWLELESRRDQLLRDADVFVRTNAKVSDEDRKKWSEAGTLDRLKLLANSESTLSVLRNHEQAKELLSKVVEAEKQFTTTLVAKELAEPRPTHLLNRGEYDQPKGEPLEPSVLTVMGTLPSGAAKDRMGLANWLVSREHPLVSRVLVNRIWQRTFGLALVRTPEDFGLQGQQPTHPQLLDWLAVELQDSGWDLKHMLRLMVTSNTFRQSSVFRTDIQDPENRLWARGPRFRMDAEVLRDIALWASQLLDPHMGGEGVKPYQPSGMWKALAHPASNTKQYVRDKGELLYRRSLYVYWKRTSPHPMMTLFDAPDRESSCVRRSRTNTSLQSLGLFNEIQRIEMARKFAERLIRGADSTDDRINIAFELLACRKPTESERSVCQNLLQQMADRYKDNDEDAKSLLSIGDAPRDETLDVGELATWTQLTSTLLASDIALILY